MSIEESKRIETLRFPLIVAVVFIHNHVFTVSSAGVLLGVPDPHFVTRFVMNLLSDGVARVAVPIFFLLAGYLFFINLDPRFEAYATKLANRSRSLVVPYVFWNVAVLGLIAFGQSWPSWQATMSARQTARVAEFGVWDYVNAIVGMDGFPIAYQFWFIRDLIILVALSPLIGLLVRRQAIVLFSLLSLAWFFPIWTALIPRLEAVLFFCVGSWLGIKQVSPFSLDRFVPLLGPAYLAMLVADALPVDYTWHDYLHQATIIIGIPCALWATRLLVEGSFGRAMATLAGSSFILFAMHEPLLSIVRKIAYKTIEPHSSATLLLLYFLLPGLVIGLVLSIHRLALRFVPRLTQIVTGGRS